MRNGAWTLEYRAESGSFLLTDGKAAYRTRPVAGITEDLCEADRYIRFRFDTGREKFLVETECFGDSAFSLTLRGDGPLEAVSFPGGFLPENGDIYLYPHGDGIRWSADKEPPLPSETAFYCGSQLSMGLLGLLRGQGGILIGIGETADAGMRWSVKDGLVENEIVFYGAKGRWGYERKIVLFAARDDAFNALCGAYRAWRRKEGGALTLLEKAERVPAVLSMAGRADVWLFDDNTMNRLYGRPEIGDVTPRDVRRAAREMAALGMDRILFHSFEGEPREDVEYLRSAGMLVGRYDIYRDVIPQPAVPYMLPYRVGRSRHTASCWPADVRLNENGEYVRAWQLHGTDGKLHDQHAVCDVSAARMITEDLPAFLKEAPYNAWFVDVSMGSAHAECFSPLHPCDRRTSMRYKNLLHRYIADLGLVSGVEVGCESGVGSYVYSEGMMSPPFFRAPDAGRRMNTLYYGDGIPENILKYDLNPLVRIPLWQMIYHDCTVNYWYWGDSSNCCPELMKLRDGFNALYAVPPLYSLNMTQWDAMKGEIAASYRRATGTARLAAFSPMIRYECPDGAGLVQRTTFENRISVTVNFSGETFEGIPAVGCEAIDRDGRKVFGF